MAYVVDTSKSKDAKLKPISLKSVKLTDNFWSKRIETMGEVTLPLQYEIIEETGRINNFRIASGKMKGDFVGFFFNDSDVYKWIEAVSFYLAINKDEKLEKLVDDVIEEIRLAQDEDGYIDTYFTFERKQDRWTNLKDMHELYCAGHLIQGAIAHHRATGKTNFLNVAIKLADYLNRLFGPGRREGTCGHPEIEMALVELYRETSDKKYLNLAKFFIDERGKGIIGGSSYHIDHKPFRELDEVVGHAVRALYLNCGATDLYMETGEKALLDALERLWDNLVTKKMYVTGGAGARKEGEAFGDNYELPNETAYAETCASIANLMWNYRMLLALGEGRFADIVELCLYNGILSGISLDGKEYFYVNPLADRGNHRRQRWFACACCPPNIARTITSIPGYMYSTSNEGVWVHLYASSVVEVDVNGSRVKIEESTNYPWDGLIEFKILGNARFKLFLRKPDWAKEYSVTVSGEKIQPVLENGYIVIDREWHNEDTVKLELSMKPEFLESHPSVKANIGRIAIRRGPIIYCLEAVDNPWGDVWDLEISKDVELEEEYRDILGGVVIVKGKGYLNSPNNWSKLYLPIKEASSIKREVDFIAIPYYAWANRESGPMEVWIKKT
ncbi:MAG: glycoside hydrolase family 127 protein [bacterium]|nr:glycoside hydrolase family 127 protein [bacterium]